MTVTLEKSPWHLLVRLRAELSESGIRIVEDLRGQATAYVWGRQDASEDAGLTKDTAFSVDFGVAFAIHAAEYELGRRGHRLNVRSAYDRYVKGLPISD